MINVALQVRNSQESSVFSSNDRFIKEPSFSTCSWVFQQNKLPLSLYKLKTEKHKENISCSFLNSNRCSVNNLAVTIDLKMCLEVSNK